MHCETSQKYCTCVVSRRHNINTGMFLASLSVAELLLLLIYLPLELTKDQLTQQFRGGAVCKVRGLIVDSLRGVDNRFCVDRSRSTSRC